MQSNVNEQAKLRPEQKTPRQENEELPPITETCHAIALAQYELI